MTVRVMAQQSGVTTQDHRFALQALFTPAGANTARSGVLAGGGTPGDLVSVSALVAKVTPFHAWVDGTSNALQAGYLLTSDADYELTFAAGDGTNPRIDVVAARIRDTTYDASGSTDGDIVILQGTPGASPAVPAVPASSLALWQVLVPANASGANPINFSSARTDRRQYTSLNGAPIPVADAAERDAIASPFAGLSAWRADTKQVERYDGIGWRPTGPAVAAAFANLPATIPSPYDGQMASTTSDDSLWLYDVGTSSWKLVGAAQNTRLTALEALTAGARLTALEALTADTGWVTSGYSNQTGWSATFTRYRVFGGKFCFLEIDSTRTGATLTADPDGHLTDSNVITIPAACQPQASWYGHFDGSDTSGGFSVSAAGMVTVRDLHSDSDIDNGETCHFRACYVVVS